MAINFPHNPNVNDVHTESSLGKSWKWDGTTWLIYSSSTTGIAFGDLSVSQQAASGSGSLTYNNAGIFTYTPPAGGGGGGSSTFVGLTDTPTGLTADKWLKVNAGGTALEFTNAPSGYTLPTASVSTLGGVKIDGTTITINGSGVISGSPSVPTSITVANENIDVECYPLFTTEATGNLAPKTVTSLKLNSSSGQLEAGSFKKTGGTSSEFLKADGSVDSTTYLSSNPSYALNDLTNVDAVTGAANGKILKYNGTSWEIADDQSGGGGGGGSTTINSNADNRIITGSASANTLNAESSLTYDGTKLNFADDKKITFGNNLRMEIYTDGTTNYIKTPSDGSSPGAFPISIHSGSSEVINIDDGNTQIKTGLKDKDGDLGTAGQILSSTGTQVNWIDAAGGTNTLSGLTDVDTSGAADGKIIKHNGTSWEISEEIQSDWNESNANLTSYIKNKPTILTAESDTLDTVTGRGDTTSNDITVGNFTCSNLTVNGTTTTVNSNTVNIGDNILVLNSDETGTPSQNGGFEIERGTSTNVSLRWNETSDKWQFTNDGTNFSDIGASGGEANVQVDWNQTTTSADDYIKNKPTLFSGAYSDLTGKPTIPAAQIQSDWNQSSTSALDFIKNKPTNILTAESDTLATVTGRGATTSTACEFQNLTATGTLTAAFLNVKDPKVVLNSDFNGSGPTEDAFVRVERGSSADVNIKWNESSDKWQATNDGTNYYDIGAEAVPTGTIVMYGSASAPSGWLLCAGQSTSGYTNLAAVVGNTVPDLRDKFVIGSGNSYNWGATGGYTDAIVVNHNHNAGNQNSNHTHAPGNSMATNFTGDHFHQQGGSGSGTTGNQSANHYHSIGANKPDGSPGVWTVTTSGGAHTHQQYRNNYSVNTPYDAHGYGRSSSTSIAQGVNTGSSNHSHTIDLTGVTTGGIDQNHTHNFNFNISGNTTYSSTGNHAHNINGNTGNESANHNHNIGSEGSSGSGRNLPPYYALCFIIKT